MTPPETTPLETDADAKEVLAKDIPAVTDSADLKKVDGEKPVQKIRDARSVVKEWLYGLPDDE